jgi:WD40 repeat protein
LKQKNVSGTIRQISFADRNTVQITTGIIINNINEIPFTTDSLIMIVHDQGVIFHDIIKNKSKLLTVAELSKTICCADFIHPNICAVGCTDGAIRIWDCKNWCLLKTIQIHIKNEILLIKSIYHSSLKM